MVRACDRTSGEICARPAKTRPLKMAFPAVAAAPQQNVAAAIKKYPRQGCDCWWPLRGLISAAVTLLGKQLVQPVRIESDQDLVSDNNGRCGAALVGSDQLEDGLLVHADIFNFKWNPFLRKVGLSPGAWRSAGRAVNNHFLCCHSSSPKNEIRARRVPLHYFAVRSPVSTPFSAGRSRISQVILAVLLSMAATLQYFSSESRTASSTALRETCPETV